MSAAPAGEPRASRGKVLVVGGGITGITAAIEASEAGCEVVLVEKAEYLGGRVARMNQYFPKMCPPQCGLEINLRRFKTNPLIRPLTQAEVEEIRGGPGDYHVTIRQHPRGVTEKCTSCGACVDVCPAERPDAFNMGMRTTKAIYLPYEMAYPLRFAIDAEACIGAECGKCVSACPFDAIDLAGLTAEDETVEVDVDAVIMATGWEPYDATNVEGLGFGTHPDIVTNVMFERMASPMGPTGGKIVKPSDGGPVSSVAFVQCAGSRDDNYLKHCSGVCCMASLKQTRYIREQYPDADIHVFYIDLRTPGRLEDFLQARQEDEKLHLVKGKVGRIDVAGDALVVQAEDVLSGTRVSQAADLVVLATGIVPSDTHGIRLEGNGGLATDEHGFLTKAQPSPGVMVAGCATQPTDVATCVRDATGAVMNALQFCTE